MKVFINKRTGTYSGGIIIVAANNTEEAQEVLLTTFPDHVCMYDRDGDQCYDIEECVFKEDWNYKRANWTELEGIISNHTTPTFIAESGHSE